MKASTFRHSFDLILCNPPYVPSPPDEFEKESNEAAVLRASWDGGVNGNDFIIPFLESLPKLLAKKGRVYLLLSSWNHPEKLVDSHFPRLELEGHLVLKRIAGRERLSVWRIQHAK